MNSQGMSIRQMNKMGDEFENWNASWDALTCTAYPEEKWIEVFVEVRLPARGLETMISIGDTHRLVLATME
jgi:hypothetical protein